MTPAAPEPHAAHADSSARPSAAPPSPEPPSPSPSPEPLPPGPPSRSQLRRLAVGLFVVVTIAAFEATAVITALPTITDELSGDDLYGVTLAANLLANIVAIVAITSAADRFGPGRPFVVSALCFVVGLAIAGLAGSIGIVVLGRVVQGAGVGGFASLSYMSVRRGFPESRQPAMYAWISAGWVLPSLIAPALAGWITDAFGWRWVFLGIIPLVGLAALLVGPPLLRMTPEPDAPPIDRRRLLDAVLAAAGVGAVLLGLAGSRLALSAALVLIGLPIALPALRRLFPTGVLRARPGLAAVIATRLCATMAFLGVDSFLPLAADRIHGVGPIAQGMLIIGAALAWSVGQALAARWNARVEPRRLIRAGFVLIAAGALGSLAVLNEDIPLLVTFGAWSVGGFGMGMLFNPTTVTGMAHAGPGEEGLTSGRLSIADSLGFAVMGGLGGAVVAWSDRSDDVPIDRAIGTNLVLAAAVAVLGLFAARNVAAPSTRTSDRVSRTAEGLEDAPGRPDLPR